MQSVRTPKISIDTSSYIQEKKGLTSYYNLMLLLGGGILNEKGLPGQALIELSNYLELAHDGSLTSLTRAWDQNFFIRDKNGNSVERWDIERLGLGRAWELYRHNILPLLKITGLLRSRFPRYGQYDTLIIHGARLEDIASRLNFIAQFWQKGGRFKKIVVLSGERELCDDELITSNWSFFKGKHIQAAGISTEIDLMKYAWKANSIVPRAVSKLNISWINTPNFKDENGQLKRGITEDTINEWFASQNKNSTQDLGRCLAVANAPLILRQHVVFERRIHEQAAKTSIETVGLAEANEGSHRILYYLREISGLLWELNKLAVLTASAA